MSEYGMKDAQVIMSMVVIIAAAFLIAQLGFSYHIAVMWELGGTISGMFVGTTLFYIYTTIPKNHI